jgi:hypothetical protein
MIVVRVELWSAVTGQKTELARMEIANDGSSPKPTRGNYFVRSLKGRSASALDWRKTQRSAKVEDWPRLSKHVWGLVAASLKALSY